MFEKRRFDMIKQKDEISELDYYMIRKLRRELYSQIMKYQKIEKEAGDKLSFKRLDIQGYLDYSYIHRLYTQSEIESLENALEVSTDFLSGRKPIYSPVKDEKGNEIESDNFIRLLRTNFIKLGLIKVNEQRYMPKDMFEYKIMQYEKYETQFKQDFQMNNLALNLLKADRHIVEKSTIYTPVQKVIILESLGRKIKQVEENNNFCKNKLEEIKEDQDLTR